MKQPVQRRLAAILVADVAGYSRLMGADEEGTHERLKAHIGQLFDPKIKEHRVAQLRTRGTASWLSSRVLWTRCGVLRRSSVG
jgi:adenylate cyclase